MVKEFQSPMSRRERQAMEIVYREGQCTAAMVQEALPDPPSYSAVRSILRLLEEKGHIRHKQVGRKYVYMPTVPATKMRHTALQNLLHTFFDDSIELVVTSLLDLKARRLTDDELDQVVKMVEEAKQKEK